MRLEPRGIAFFAAMLLSLPACGSGGTGPALAGGNDAARGVRSSPTTSTALKADDRSAAPAEPTVMSGAEDTRGVTEREIVFGMHLPQSGPTGALIGDAWKGADAYFRTVNDSGGVHGRQLKLVVVDDKYSAQGAATAVRELIDRKNVFAVTCPAGVDQCSVTADHANGRNVPFLSGGFREQYLEDKPWVFPVTASSAYGATRLLDYMFDQRGFAPSRRLGFFYLHSENLDEMVGAAERHLAQLGSRFTVKYAAEKDQSDFSAAVTKFRSAGVDTIWFHTAPDLITKFAAQARIAGYQPQYVFTLPLGGDIWAASAGGNLDKAFGLAGFADPQWTGTAPFQEAFHRYHPQQQTDEFNLLCYGIARVFVEGARQAGPNLGRDSFRRAMANVEIDTGVSQPISYSKRGRVAGPNSQFAVWEIHGTQTDQISGFSW